ncbi:hypothetical protein B005_1206 [Nocardiopsis alba ATCC BAA-2165]|uniref:Uncharacterized protein n=1 Tax=Nocardiopsis alba (strain ATCC BAA-2165 / BE74) TaxID=1205910 RepID=J7KX27_NOCAA|nr:hypothetical protein B005_1206 [Nocardiopsis alba ATCC BAA-2165]
MASSVAAVTVWTWDTPAVVAVVSVIGLAACSGGGSIDDRTRRSSLFTQVRSGEGGS